MGTKPRQTRCLQPDPFLTFTTPATTTATTTQDPHVIIPSSGDPCPVPTVVGSTFGSEVCPCGKFYMPKGSNSVINVNDNKVDLVHDEDIFVSAGQEFQTISNELDTGSSIFPSKLSLNFTDGGIASEYLTDIYDNLKAEGQVVLTVSSINNGNKNLIAIKKINTSIKEHTVVGKKIDFVGSEIVGNHDVNNSKLILKIDSICDEEEQENICDTMGSINIRKLKDPLCQGLSAPNAPYLFGTSRRTLNYNSHIDKAGHPIYNKSFFRPDEARMSNLWSNWPNENEAASNYQAYYRQYYTRCVVRNYDYSETIMPKITRYEIYAKQAGQPDSQYRIVKKHYDPSFQTRGVGYHNVVVNIFQEDFYNAGFIKEESSTWLGNVSSTRSIYYYFKFVAVNAAGISSFSNSRYIRVYFK